MSELNALLVFIYMYFKQNFIILPGIGHRQYVTEICLIQRAKLFAKVGSASTLLLVNYGLTDLINNGDFII